MAGRPREFDRDMALKKAMLAFWRRGYEGTSMSDLVEVMGIASARIYAAFGSKEALFQEAVALYEQGDGGFADRAFREETDVRAAIERMLRDAVAAYTRRGYPHGCMVVSSATNYSADNEGVMEWLAEHRRARTQSIAERLRAALAQGQLKPGTEVEALADFYATQLHGISVQSRDGVSKDRLLASLEPAMMPLEMALR
ncbi:TetR family transcriptional regulator [Burkholderia stabilis]|uniref:TetR/AcrR family transcriptional regulator n=1 Tax=Burkholderia stabilis TaxID=95485 RepID=UPI0008519885|nr:TetR/AcrR family transcriptional regulator [Burkholderia stabilis]AOR72260.1 TetR family transcriptional regulator [Burkholderia stabilis]HDR9492199.1 TetR/AcrR family transcriptional regulator [Burkholderia stabilis]HDR9522443.1 TetR/AcrR family transcriptional regulator [Burkholderia stabilis]HDR9530297.1 TetR/AcrR family transcriptional regulator [Burkholderia stabilis]HDR9539821.1 TetR/AcrR family transcriptional regulator [Burkholderia stabilis]